MLAGEIFRGDMQHVTIAIDDASLGAMHAYVDIRYEEIDVGQVPPDVIAYCRWLDVSVSPAPPKREA